MTPDQFVFWLRGYLAAGGAADSAALKEALASVGQGLKATMVMTQPSIPDGPIKRALDREKEDREKTREHWGTQQPLLCAAPGDLVGY